MDTTVAQDKANAQKNKSLDTKIAQDMANTLKTKVWTRRWHKTRQTRKKNMFDRTRLDSTACDEAAWLHAESTESDACILVPE
jgi:hypothetical protein